MSVCCTSLQGFFEASALIGIASTGVPQTFPLYRGIAKRSIHSAGVLAFFLGYANRVFLRRENREKI